MNPELEHLAHRVVSGLFNGVYQGMALALVLWLGLRLFRRVNAATRHAAAFVTLLLVAFLPLLHIVHSGTDKPGTGVNTTSVEEPAAPAAPVRQTVETPAVREAAPFVATAGRRKQVEFPQPSFEAVTTRRSSRPLSKAHEVQPSSVVPREPVASETGAVAQAPLLARLVLPTLTPGEWKAALPGLISVLILAGIGLIGGARLVRLGAEFFELGRLKRSCLQPDAETSKLFSEVLADVRPGRPVRLGIGDRFQAPMVIGYRRPVVLLPAQLVEAAEAHQLEGVLRHELAHVQRRDDWFNLVQQAIRAFWFFNPAVWWLSRRLTLDREIACDDHALAKTRSPQDYALLLAEFAGRCRGRDRIAAPAAWSSRSQLKERINMILDTKRNTSHRLARTSVGALTVVSLLTTAVALIGGPRLVLAAATEQPDGIRSSATSGRSFDSGTVSEPRHKEAGSHGTTATVVSSTDTGAVIRPTSATAVLRPFETTIAAPVEVEAAVTTGAHVVHIRPNVLLAQVPVPVEPMSPPKAPKAPKPADPASVAHPHPVPVPVSSEDHRESLERRLERLERQLERLTGGPEIHLDFSAENTAGEGGGKQKPKVKDKQGNSEIPGFQFEHFAFDHPEWPMDEVQQKAVEQAMKEAETQVALAMKEVGRAAREARRQAEVEARISREMFPKMVAGVEQQRRVLEQQRNALERQMENLERQMEHLDEELERVEEQLEDREELEEQRGNTNSNDDTASEDRR